VYCFGYLLRLLVTPASKLQTLDPYCQFTCDGSRWVIPASAPPRFVQLLNSCCSRAPETRPHFTQIVSDLVSIREQVVARPPAAVAATASSSGSSSSTSISRALPASSSSSAAASALSTPPRTSDIAIAPTDKVTLWIDNNVIGSNAELAKRIESENPNTHVLQFASLNNVRTWIDERQDLVKQLVARGGLRLVTNAFRQADGGAKAGAKTCEWVRRTYKSTVPVLLFCARSSADQVADLHMPRSKVWVSSDLDVATAFMAAKRPYDMPPLASK
jgi:hypothetical protein